jgi:tubby-related protein 1
MMKTTRGRLEGAEGFGSLIHDDDDDRTTTTTRRSVTTMGFDVDYDYTDDAGYHDDDRRRRRVLSRDSGRVPRAVPSAPPLEDDSDGNEDDSSSRRARLGIRRDGGFDRGAMARPASIPSWANVRARRQFATSPVVNDGTHVRCHVSRRRGPFGLFPTYVLYLDGSQTTTTRLADATPVLIARKRKKAKCTHYVIGDDGAERSVNETHASYVGKLKANFIGTRFELLDSGSRPRAWGSAATRGFDDAGFMNADDDDDHDDDDDDDDGPPRRRLASVRYAVNPLGARGPRTMSVSLFRRRGENGTPQEEDSCVELVSATPKWNPVTKAYVLRFNNGRVTRPSVKNFQLVHRRRALKTLRALIRRFSRHSRALGRAVRPSRRRLVHARLSRFPLSPLDAFAACLSAFESKFARE